MLRTPYELLLWASRTLDPLGCECVIAWGSSVVEDFDRESSDVDLVVVYDFRKVELSILKDVAVRMLKEGYDLLLWPVEALSDECPYAWHASGGRIRIVHAIEVFLIKQHSRVICGKDLRRLLWDVNHLDSLRISALFFYDSLRRISPERMKEMEPPEFRQYARTAVRILAEFETKTSLSKDASVRWLISQKREGDFAKLQVQGEKLLEWETRVNLKMPEIAEIVRLSAQYLVQFLNQAPANFTGFSLELSASSAIQALREGVPVQLPRWVHDHVERGC